MTSNSNETLFITFFWHAYWDKNGLVFVDVIFLDGETCMQPRLSTGIHQRNQFYQTQLLYPIPFWVKFTPIILTKLRPEPKWLLTSPIKSLCRSSWWSTYYLVWYTVQVNPKIHKNMAFKKAKSMKLANMLEAFMALEVVLSKIWQTHSKGWTRGPRPSF